MFNLRGLLYYSKDTLHTYTSGMYLIGNHALHWTVRAMYSLDRNLIRFECSPGELLLTVEPSSWCDLIRIQVQVTRMPLPPPLFLGTYTQHRHFPRLIT